MKRQDERQARPDPEQVSPRVACKLCGWVGPCGQTGLNGECPRCGSRYVTRGQAEEDGR